MAHTPGPWTIYDTSNAAIKIKGQNPKTGGEHIAVVVMPDNARLIAVAPDMLKALNAFHDAYACDDASYADKINAANKLMMAALAKVESKKVVMANSGGEVKENVR